MDRPICVILYLASYHGQQLTIEFILSQAAIYPLVHNYYIDILGDRIYHIQLRRSWECTIYPQSISRHVWDRIYHMHWHKSWRCRRCNRIPYQIF